MIEEDFLNLRLDFKLRVLREILDSIPKCPRGFDREVSVGQLRWMDHRAEDETREDGG